MGVGEGQIAWVTEDVQILNTWRIMEGKAVGPLIVDVARKGDDGILRRVANYCFDQEADDMLRTLREMRNGGELERN